MAGEHFVMNIIKTARGTACFETEDNTRLRLPADFFIKGAKSRDSQGQAARLAQQFLKQNWGILRDFAITSSIDYDGSAVSIDLQTGGQTGALPLLSPTSGRPDYGLVIKPRFGWQGIGPMLGTMGWKILPEPLPLPLLPRSDRKIPPWVLSSTVLLRLQKLLDQLERRFEYTEADLSAPRGQISWAEYALTRIPRAAFLNIPCRYPDLRDDHELKAAIHFTLRKQLAALQSQRTAGLVVLQLLKLCQELLERVRDIPALQPSPKTLSSWFQSHLGTTVFRDGIQAVEWTVDERGLAGLSDLQGLPWILPMDLFFEAWVETVVGYLARQAGGMIKTGRQRQTVTPLGWSPPYLGSQRYLLPDVILEREQETIIFDAKYKNHWEELSREGWFGIDQELRERHRSDLLQVLAYSTASASKRVICCLAYPCRAQTWSSLLRRQRPYHKASVRAGSRRVDLVLTAIPMGLDPEEICPVLTQALSA